ncbi:MAG: type II toxin-antitoxin system VapC family toxin [Betaproteobacteria bacterium]
MVIADTSVWVDFLRGSDGPHCETLAALLEEQEVALCDRVLQEVLQGVREDGEFRRVSTRLLALPCYNLGGEALAVAAARNYRRLRRLGVTPRSATDALIAAFCIEESHELLHRDRDFEPFVRHLGLKTR